MDTMGKNRKDDVSLFTDFRMLFYKESFNPTHGSSSGALQSMRCVTLYSHEISGCFQNFDSKIRRDRGKISHERCIYESVDVGSLFEVLSQKSTEK